MSSCPCGSTNSYERCCRPYLEEQQEAPTPEQLMRSRYTAYSLANIEYIKQTMLGKPLIQFNESEAKKWAEKAIWIELKVLDVALKTAEQGFVEFIAAFIEQNQLKTIHELSEFHKKEGRWFYVDGVPQGSPQKHARTLARNSPCPCSSGKKFKNCHGR